jgi:hypothetical protein
MLMALLKVHYPAFYHRQTDSDVRLAAGLWAEYFAEDDAADVMRAVKQLVAARSETWPPNIGAVKEQLARLTVNLPSEMDAWASVCKACGNGFYGHKQEWARLDPFVQKIVSPEQIREWSVVAIDELQTVIKGYFSRAYNASKERAMFETKTTGTRNNANVVAALPPEEARPLTLDEIQALAMAESNALYLH